MVMHIVSRDATDWRKIIHCISCVVCACWFISCNGLSPSDPADQSSKGTLVLAFSPGKLFLQKTIEPDLDMTLDAFDVFGSGPGEAMFEEAGIPQSSVFQLSLVPGSWKISVEGKNKDGVVIGTGESSIELEPGVVMNETIHVVPIEGKGFLSIDVSWPDSVLTDPAVSGNLSAAGESAQSMTFTPEPDGLSAIYQDSLSSGYYTVIVQLTDADEPVWGTTEAARILAGHPSSRSYQLVDGVNRSGYRLDLVDDLQNPIEITLSGIIENLLPGEIMTVVAQTSEPVDRYQWYLQGDPIAGATADSLTVGGNLDAGTYWLDLLVQSGAVLSSEQSIFQILQTEDDGTRIGPLVINEFMADPEKVDDKVGEWFEIVNIGSTEVDLEYWVIRDEGSDFHTINQSLVVPPEEYLVFGRSADDSLNGGIAVDYEYQGINLTNETDAIFLVRDDGTIIDAVRWGGASQLPTATGASTALKDPRLDNRRSKNWRLATVPYGSGDKGTPGEPNEDF